VHSQFDINNITIIMYSTRRQCLFLASVYRSAGTQTVGNTNLNTRHREDNPFLHQNKISISTVGYFVLVEEGVDC
jgi:hypothetical protein